jgi:DNA-binding NtrC family response regulator
MDKVLLVEDDVHSRAKTALFLEKHCFEVLLAADTESASRLFAQIPDIIVTDLMLVGSDGMEVLREARELLPETPIIITTGHGSISSAVDAMKRGAFDYLTKPIDPEELLVVIHRAAEQSKLQREVRHLRQQVRDRGGLLGMVGNSEPMRHVFEQIQLIAPTHSTTLITGESGTGKELVARAIHQLSPRSDRAFIPLNCAAIPKELAESELFGHEKGAFTGATERRIGKFAAAHRGTLLIDEIGEMELPVQAKLVRALETRAISPVGSNNEQSVDVRVIAATHRNLRTLVADSRFREDLYYRLHVVVIEVSPLRERPEDIPLLVSAFLLQLNAEHGRTLQQVSPDTMDCLRDYRWPGNVRELRNLLEGLIVLSRGDLLQLSDLPLYMRRNMPSPSGGGFNSGMTISELEREAIQQSLTQTGGNRHQTAQILGISTRTLLRKIRKYKLEASTN